MDGERHSDYFSEGLIIGIFIGHYVKPYAAPLWMRIVFWIIVVGVFIRWLYSRIVGKKYKKKPD